MEWRYLRIYLNFKKNK